MATFVDTLSVKKDVFMMAARAQTACCTSSTEGAEDQRIRADEQLTPEQTLAPPEDSEKVLRASAHVIEKVLDVLQNSTIESMSGEDNWYRFWDKSQRNTTTISPPTHERHGEYLALSRLHCRHGVQSQSRPQDTTNALLAQIGFGNFTAAGAR
ncbi:uncharacterized protein F5147DRAFT_656223 [Suillus discolor]|uniref:Uncharacterized protein n=1 Tax=Suillus discolor TaxID=1912936 RepID=A0A9P7JQ93_9AGAM|nr:uncharacterized protein F5147DRAFT_656223 [Suillus discolor]KAG2097988.1 hypothetical protein F5147DRAFT_656223 [Suillus discolor]